MRKIILIVTLLVPFFRVLAQKSETSLNAYFKNTNRAEVFIIEENYKAANESYKEAFKATNGILFGNDLFNAFLSSLYAEDYVLCSKYIDSMAYYGVKKELINHRIKKEGKEAFLTIGTNYDSIQQIGKNNMDQEWLRRSDSFVMVDQDIRKKRKASANIKDLAALDSINFNAFLTAIEKFGFPTLQKIGFYAESSSDPLVTNAFSLLLWHQRGAVFNEIIENKLVQYVQNGWLLPYDYVVARPEKYQYYGLVPTNDMSVKEIEKINRHRQNIRMESVEEYKAKMNKKFKVEGISVISQIPFNFHNVFVSHTYENQ